MLIPTPHTASNGDLPDYYCDGKNFGYEPPTGSCYEALEIMPTGMERHSFGHGPGLDMVEMPWRVSSREFFSLKIFSLLFVSVIGIFRVL